MNRQPPSENYYLNYFLQMLHVVEARYKDLLSKSDLEFLEKINSTDEVALRLLIRLYIRKGPNFLSEKLDYLEVPNTKHAIHILGKAGLIEVDPLVYVYELVELLPIAQSRELFPADDRKIKKSDLLELWLQDEELRHCSQWQIDDEIITPCHYESIRRLQLLFFGNEHQSLTEFILEDLGLFKYELYALDESNRFFNDTEDINTTLQLNDLNSEFYLLQESKDWTLLPEISERAWALSPSNALKPRWHKLINKIAYRVEQQGDIVQALKLFSTNEEPLARERRCRILFKQAQYFEAEKLLHKIKSNPKSSKEFAFYRRFVNKVNKKLDRTPEAFTPHKLHETKASWTRFEGTVEEQACQHFSGSVWLENNLPMSVFGLIHWHIVFANIKGVWHHPFQSAPADLTSHDFVSKRKDAIQNCHQHLKDEWREIICNNWSSKNGISNPFVNWQHLDIDIVLSCFDALSKDQWLGIFEHILLDIRHNRSGFPDLFQWHDNKYRFIEIKGPGDKLQDNQITWLNKFSDLGINADVCYVQYL